MALCHGCHTPIPCLCHLGPPPKAGPNVYIAEERHPANRPDQNQDSDSARQDGAQQS